MHKSMLIQFKSLNYYRGLLISSHTKVRDESFLKGGNEKVGGGGIDKSEATSPK